MEKGGKVQGFDLGLVEEKKSEERVELNNFFFFSFTATFDPVRVQPEASPSDSRRRSCLPKVPSVHVEVLRG